MSLPTSIRAQDYVVDPSFNPTFGGRTHQFWDFTRAVALQPDQKILVGGNFTTVNGDSSSLIVRLNPNGTRDTTFNSGLGAMANDEVETIKVLPDGKILVAGVFRVAGVLTRLVRLNSDGSVDGTFSSAAGGVKAIETYPDGKFVACGCFATGGTSRVGRFNQDGSVDTSFQANISGNCCLDLKLLPDGSMYAAGTFTGSDGFGAPGLVKLNSNGTRDMSFNLPPDGYPSLNREFYRIALQPDGKLIAAYKLWYLTSQGELSAAWGINRYDSTGSPQYFYSCDGGFETGTEIFLQADGRIITNACRPQGQPSYLFGRLHPDGTFDTALNRLNFDNGTRRFVRQADGSYIVIGSFNSVDGFSRQRIARLVTNLAQARHKFDFDGDGKDDLAVFRPGDRYWYMNQSMSGFAYVQWGLATDKLIAADYDNDGKTDVAVFRDGQWYILKSSDSTLSVQSFGQAGDKPLVGDINGDGKVDMIVRRLLPTNVIEWQIRYFGSSGISATQSLSGENFSDKTAVGDFDGDNADEIAYFRGGKWYSRKVATNAPLLMYQWGIAGDMPTPGDYDRDGQTDYAVFRPSNGDWHINLSASGYIALHFGANGDIPVPADYDGDGKTDVAVFRNGAWYQFLSSNNTFKADAWGLSGDIPIPAQSF